MQSSVDVLAKLLATENINIIRTNSHTASFDIKNRVLNLPKWKEMSTTVEEMLILHEVGHALYTSNDGYVKGLENLKRVISGYANVIEDVRIERKIKELYPGCRRSFFLGYKELNDRDFFNVRGKDLKDYILIDRINLYYKVGFNCGVSFSEEERKFLLRIERCETEREVIQLAQEIYEFSKKEAEENSKKLKSIFGEEVEEDEYDPLDDEDEFGFSSDYSEDEEDEEVESQKTSSLQGEAESTEDDDSSLESKTYNAVKEKLESLSDEDSRVVYVAPEFWTKRGDGSKIVVPYKVILEEIEDWYKSHELQVSPSSAAESSSKVVSYLIKEFEMKKAATAYKYAKTSKLGQLDVKKLYAYKLKDDIFRQITKTQDGKKHGMVFLLDWSGSMQNYIQETIDQVVNLSLFCHRAQIPFRVFAFTDRFHADSTNTSSMERCKNYTYNYSLAKYNHEGIGSETSFSLMELFSNKMSKTEIANMIKYLSCLRFLPPSMQLGGTPLNDSLVFMADYIGKFKIENSVEKMSFITLTDGESSPLNSGYNSDLTRGKTWSRTNNKLINTRAYLRDPLTKKEYSISKDSTEQTAALMSLIKDRYNCTNLSFFVVKNSYREILRFCNSNYTNYINDTISNIRISIKSNGYSILKNIPGRDEFYVIDSKNLNVEDGSIDNLDSNSNSRQIARSFSKMMNTRKTSRVVLNNFITQVA